MNLFLASRSRLNVFVLNLIFKFYLKKTITGINNSNYLFFVTMRNQIFQFLFQIIFRYPCICLFDYWVILKVGKFFRILFLINLWKSRTWKFTYETATPANCKNKSKICTYMGPWPIFPKFYLTFTLVSYNKRLFLVVIEQGLKGSCIFSLLF